MKNILTQFKNNFSKASVNRKLYVFLVCFVLSAFYWLLNVLGNSYNTTLKVNTTYKNNPENYIILNDLPKTIDVEISGIGYYLLIYKLGLKTPSISIDLSKINILESNKQKVIYFNEFESTIENQLGNKIELESIYPLSYNVILDEITEKLIKVIPLMDISFGSQYQLSDTIKVVPNFIKITGPKIVLDTLKKVPSVLLKLNNIESSQQIEVELNNHFLKLRKLTTETKSIQLQLEVDRFTEYNIKIPIKTKNLPENMDVTVFPNQVEIKFMVSLSKLSTINEFDFSASVDCSSINSQFKKIKVNLDKYPTHIKSISLKPANVEYVLRRNEN